MKKIAMIVPSLLLTSCLFGCGNKNVDPFMITSADNFNKAVNFTGIKHLQAARMLVNYNTISTTLYAEYCMSPNVYYQFDRYSYSSDPGVLSQYYAEKTSSGVCYRYDPPEAGQEKWKQTVAGEGDFRTPLNEKDNISSILALGNVNYDLIKNNYDKERQAYYFKTTNTSDKEYDVIMSFYSNRLTYLSYCSYSDDYTQTELAVYNYTYGTINPTLPPYDPVEP